VSSFILISYGIFFAVLIGLGAALIIARRRVTQKLTALEQALNPSSSNPS